MMSWAFIFPVYFTTVALIVARSNVVSDFDIQDQHDEARQVTTSQVLIVNLKNILLVVLLKLAIGSGFLFHTDKFLRSFDGSESPPIVNNFMTARDFRWAGVFFLCRNVERYDCLYRHACENPREARDYISAGRKLLSVFKEFRKILPYDPKYAKILVNMNKAMRDGTRNPSLCGSYHCGIFDVFS